MRARSFFPLGKAYGEAFCNRTNEIKQLLGNIENGKHTFINATRRYGKSSLCEKAISSSGLAHAKVDLHVATSEKGVERCILKGIIELIGKAVGPVDKSLHKIKHVLKNLKPKLSFEAAGFQLEFDIEAKASVAEVLREAILILDVLLVDKDKRAILLLDEFQRVAEIEKEAGIEGGIRSAAQETQNLSIIFSGSNRHLMEQIFQDKLRPLYKLCKKIRLDRIDVEHYHAHLNKAAHLMWKSSLSEDAFSKIMTLTQRHPYYINYLCDYLWTDCADPPQIDDIDQIWNELVEEERSDLLNEYFQLSENQKKILKYISVKGGNKIFSQEVANETGMVVASMSYTLNTLIKRDLIESIGDSKYRVINPLYRDLLAD